MTDEEYRYDQFTSLVRRNEKTIQKIGAVHCKPYSYNYDEMVCDLITHLWLVYRSLPDGGGIRDEEAWVFTIAYRYALKLIRDEGRRQQHFVYGADLTVLADTDGRDPYVDKFYHIVGQLDETDQELITMYIDGRTTKELAKSRNTRRLTIQRRIAKIRDTIIEINKTIKDDDFD